LCLKRKGVLWESGYISYQLYTGTRTQVVNSGTLLDTYHIWNTAGYIPHLEHKKSSPHLDSLDHRSTILGSRPTPPPPHSPTSRHCSNNIHSICPDFYTKQILSFQTLEHSTVKSSRSLSHVAVCKSTVHLLGFPTGALLWTLDHREPTMDHTGDPMVVTLDPWDHTGVPRDQRRDP